MLLILQFHREHTIPNDNCKICEFITLRPLLLTFSDVFTEVSVHHLGKFSFIF